MDFVTGLPPSKGNTVIVMVVDRFTKAAHFLALPKHPTALETANLLVDQVFRLHGTPSNIVSRGPPNLLHKFGGLLPRPWETLSACHHGYQAKRANQELESVLQCMEQSSSLGGTCPQHPHLFRNMIVPL